MLINARADPNGQAGLSTVPHNCYRYRCDCAASKHEQNAARSRTFSAKRWEVPRHERLGGSGIMWTHRFQNWQVGGFGRLVSHECRVRQVAGCPIRNTDESEGDWTCLDMSGKWNGKSCANFAKERPFPEKRKKRYLAWLAGSPTTVTGLRRWGLRRSDGVSRLQPLCWHRLGIGTNAPARRATPDTLGT